MLPLRSLPLILAAGALLSCSALIAQEAAPIASAVRIVDRIDESNLVTLAGNTHPMAKARNDLGRVSPDLPMTDLILVLRRSPEQQADFDRFTDSQYDPSSPNFHQWLEPEEVGERFGPAQSDIDVTASWLRGHGFLIDAVSKDRMSIRFSGKAAQVEEAFHTEIHSLDVKGVPHIANMSDPLIPAALAPVVVGPKALHNFFPKPLHVLGSKVRFNREVGKWQRIAGDSAGDSDSGNKSLPYRPHPEYGISTSNGPVEDVVPYDFAAMYNVLPSWAAGIDGAGQTIAVAGTSDIDLTDVTTFRKTFGLPPGLPVKQLEGVNGLNPGECGVTPNANCNLGDQIENTLDVEWSGAVAKGAQILLATSGLKSTTDDTVYDSSQYIIEKKLASILNVSYGLCELGEGTAGNASYNNLWQMAYTAGVAVFVAAGDSGSASCDDGGDQGGANVPYVAEFGLTVSGVASSPYDTAVGGTDLNWGSTASPYWSATNNSATGASALGYIPEVPWNDSCVNPLVLSYVQSAAQSLSVSTPSDAEMACNFVVSYYQEIDQLDGVDLSSLVDTVGGGGGRSNCTTNDGANPSSCKGGYGKPVWQTGVPGIPAGYRNLPDVSFFASNGFLGSAYLVCVSAAGTCETATSTTVEPTAQEIGGTSVASPAMAGVMALINQKATAPQGSPNAMLYALAAKQSYSSCSTETVKTSSACYFNDIDTGTNSQPCDWGLVNGDSPNCQRIHSGDTVGILKGYGALAGFDQATGLGSLNVANVVKAWPIAMVPVANFSAASLAFAGTLKGIASPSQTITLKNTGREALSLTGTGKGVSISGLDASSFSETNTCGASVAVNASCAIAIVFKPAATGSLTASLSVADNASGSPQLVSLTGTGTAPAVKLSSTSLGFAGTAIGGSATSKVTLTNSGTGPLALNGAGQGISVTGTGASSFLQANSCGSGLAAGRSCTITVTFKPVASGALTADISVADSASPSPQRILLSGTGLGPVLSPLPSKLAFFHTEPDVADPPQTVTLRNTGNAALSLNGAGLGISFQGTDISSFSQTNNCGSSLAPGKSCAIEVTFKPVITGNLTADLRIGTNSAGSPHKIALSGTGQGAIVSLSRTTLTFPSTAHGSAAGTQSFTLTDKGNYELGVSGNGHSILITGVDASSYSQTNTCGSVLAAGKSCIITVTFKPAAAGTLTAAVTFTDNAGNSPQSVKLTGTGQ
jgi:subtilase family serine protease